MPNNASASERAQKKSLAIDVEKEEWLTAEQFAGFGDDFPTTTRGARMRLQRLAQHYPELRKSNPQRKGSLYHISLKDMPLPEVSTRDKPQQAQTEQEEQYNLWKQLYKTIPEEEQKRLLSWAMKEVGNYLNNRGK